MSPLPYGDFLFLPAVGNIEIYNLWSKKFPGCVFWLKKLKNDIEIALKLTDIEL